MKKIINLIKSLFFFKAKKIDNCYISICCIQKDENEYLLEWIDYHQKIGVEHFYIYNNDSQISPKPLLRKHLKSGLVTLINIPGKNQQLNAYNLCIQKYGSLSKWIAFIDIDEFIVPKSTNGNLREFLEKFEDYGAVGVNWLIFGSNGHKVRNGESVINKFLKRSAGSTLINTHIKSIVQPKYVLRNDNPHFFWYLDDKFCVNENYEKINGPFSPHSSEKIQINHYQCKSEEEYMDRIKRGCADGRPDVYKMQSFFDVDKIANEVIDESAVNIYNKLKKL
ncbi:glycosyltransferase family 92 protein [Rhizosphaericola mali]|uniref:Glycosyltransferase family 2 protein n=1 Tax=Rhizosphaericola mali TaxID=2545455 RepID=A0A5P2G9Z2_9BACT|nr:glycosyltransferase family 92 protein [Rhizosphaericola mali]QES90520.1 hypothetical protein E0W69_018275 [Rhizosphaericola mali]